MDDDIHILGRAYDSRLMRRLWRVTRPHRGLIWLSFVLLPLTAGAELLQPYLVKLAIDEHILPRDWSGLGGLAAVFLATLLALYGLRVAQAYVMQLTGQRVMADLRHMLFAHLQGQDAAFFDRNPVGRLMTRVLNDVEAINEVFVSGVVAVVGDVVVLTGVVVIMLGMNWRLALVTFALVPALVVAVGFFRVRAREAYRRVRARLAHLNASLQESLQGVAVIQLFARERREGEIFAGLNGALRLAQFRSTRFEAALYASVEGLGSAAVALLLWYGGGEVLAGALTFGGLVAFIEYTNRFFLPIRDLGAKYTVMQAAMVSSERVFGLLDTVPAVRDGAPPAPAARVTPPERRAAPPDPGDPRVTPALELRSVWFAYGGERWVLRDCSLAVAPGEHVALVGPTGEGKTTIVRLLTRAYDVARGQALVAGVDVRDWPLADLRRHVGLVPQDVFLFSGTVRENLVLGAHGRVSETDVERALQQANAESLVRALPGGLDAEIRERGVNLSHGQRQLLAIARALIYNPPVLLLDEATSSVDAESERLIRDALTRLLRGRASLAIAHRLSTIQSADRILVLHGGHIREAGRHGELVAGKGMYARLYELEFGASPG